MRIAVAALLTMGAAFGQTNGPLVLRFTNTATPQGRQEVVNSLRGVGEIESVALSDSAGTVAVSGSSGQLTLAQWLFRELDEAGTPAPHEYDVPGGADDVVRVFYPTSPQNPQQLQEMINAVRSITELQRVTACFGPKAIAARGTAAQIAAMAWMVNDIDTASAPGVHTYGVQIAGRRDPVVVTVHLANMTTPQATQEIVTTVRSLSELQRVVALSGRQMIVMRGDSGQMALGEWLIAQLDQKSAARGVQQFAPAVMPGDAARVFFLSHVNTPQALQELVKQVRAVAKVQRVVSFPELQAVALRAPTTQVTESEQLIAVADQVK